MASVLQPTEPQGAPDDPDGLLTEEMRQRVETVAEEKRRAIAEAGPSWHDWLYFDALRWWSIILFLIADSWVAVVWIQAGNYLGMALSVVLVCYVEFLLFQVLWHRPEGPLRRRWNEPFRRTWWRPVEIGRWTPEKALLDRRAISELPSDAIDPDEFL